MVFFVSGMLLLLRTWGCSSEETEARPLTIIVGRPADPMSLDPARVTDSESIETCEQIFEHLLRYAADSMKPEPQLATTWSHSEDGTLWTFRLRRGVRFHDGSPFTADAVVWSFQRQLDPRHPDHKPDFVYWESSLRNIQGVRKVDDYTVQIQLERPNAAFLADLAMFPVSILSPAAVARAGKDYERMPVGTGPFKFVEWVPGERLTLAANHDYWGGAPAVKYLVFRPIQDPSERLSALEAGALHVNYGISPRDIPFVKLHPGFRLTTVSGNNIAYLAMNTRKWPFTDLRVRRAVNHAINKGAMVKLIHQGLAQVARGPLPPGVRGHKNDLPDYPYDVNLARALFEEAQVPKGHPVKLYAPSTPRPYLPSPERVAQILRAHLRDVGFTVELVLQPFPLHIQSLSKGEHDLALHGWTSDNGDPDNFLSMLLDMDPALLGVAKNYAFYRNPFLHGILTEAREAWQDEAHRMRLYGRAQEIIQQDAPWVPLWHSGFTVVSARQLAGVVPHPTTIVYYHRVRYER